MTDPISDMLTRIRNAQTARQDAVRIPFSSIKFELAKILEREGFIAEVDKKGRGAKRLIHVALRYADGMGAIEGVRRVSRPGQRVYVNAGEIPRVKQGYGIAILSTSKGLFIDREARKAHLGGEVICEVW